MTVWFSSIQHRPQMSTKATNFLNQRNIPVCQGQHSRGWCMEKLENREWPDAGDAINSLAVVANARVVLSHRVDCEMLLVTFKYCSDTAAAAAVGVERPLAAENEQQKLINYLHLKPFLVIPTPLFHVLIRACTLHVCTGCAKKLHMFSLQ